MARRTDVILRPKCPRPRHEGSRVLLNGQRGPEGHKRVRWLCVPENGERRHQFSEPLPRLNTTGGLCLECERHYMPHEGPQSARDYLFSIRDIASTLVRVGKGDCYSEAAAFARGRAHRWPHDSEGVERRSFHSQLAMDWVAAYAPVVAEPYHDFAWPTTGALLLDELPFRLKDQEEHKKRGLSAFTILCAMGWQPSKGGRGRMRLWKMEAVPGRPVELQHAWEDFLRSLEGQPEYVVCDRAHQIRQAVSAVWPEVHTHFCEHHLRQNCYQQLAKLGLARKGWRGYVDFPRFRRHLWT